MSTNTTPTPRTDAIQHGGERLDSLAKELAGVDELGYRAAVEELYMDAAKELAAAKAENAALRKDRERLDWLEAHVPTHAIDQYVDKDDPANGFAIERFGKGGADAIFLGVTLRAAIDSAMEGGER